MTTLPDTGEDQTGQLSLEEQYRAWRALQFWALVDLAASMGAAYWLFALAGFQVTVRATLLTVWMLAPVAVVFLAMPRRWHTVSAETARGVRAASPYFASPGVGTLLMLAISQFL